MNIMVFDTETIDVNKRFCYNVGYVIADTSNGNILAKRDFVVEQIWHNPELFHTAYYHEKRPLYVAALRSRKAILNKWGYICQQMYRDIKNFNITTAYAYNCDFDIGVFDYNCDWFKTINPLDTLEVKDIRDYAYNAFVDEHYKQFCEDNNCFTESGNYSTTAETMYKYVFSNPNFIEAHTALSDSEIEFAILYKALKISTSTPAKAPMIVERCVERELTIVDTAKVEHKFKYYSKKHYKSKDKIVLN